jgi:hypothetical protein
MDNMFENSQFQKFHETFGPAIVMPFNAAPLKLVQ